MSTRSVRKFLVTVVVAGVASVGGTAQLGAASTVSPRRDVAAAGCASYTTTTTLPVGLCDKGALVVDIQRRLNLTGRRINVDGYFGPSTLAAVKEFQFNHYLRVDGLVGPRTYTSMLAYGVSCTTYRHSNALPLVPCTRGVATAYVQAMLNAVFKAKVVNVDGYYGPRTVAAVQRFQWMAWVQVDGRVGQQTLAALIDWYTIGPR